MNNNQEGSAKSLVAFLVIAIVFIAVLLAVSLYGGVHGQSASFTEDFNDATMESLQAGGWSTWSKSQMPEVLDNLATSASPESVSLENGMLKATGAGGFLYSADWDNYSMTFRFRTNASPGSFWCGLAFRADSTWTSEDWPQNAYILQLGYSGSTNRLWKTVDGTWTQLASSDNFELNINPEISNLWHDVTLDANGSSLKVYVDNQLLISSTDGSLTSGSVGLLNRGNVYFDDLVKTSV